MCDGASPTTCALCGDGIVEAFAEACDDGNLEDGDGCSASCEVEVGQGFSCNGEPSVCDVCGNGDVGGTEECDDGNLDDGDTCTSVCTIAVEQCNVGACGERVVDGGYDGSIGSMTCLAREIESIRSMRSVWPRSARSWVTSPSSW